VINLGANGKLIMPVQVDGGKWYYYWDRSGDGTGSGTLGGTSNSTNGDLVSMNEMEGRYALNNDITFSGTASNIDETYRYGQFLTTSGNYLTFALPTSGRGGGLPKPGLCRTYPAPHPGVSRYLSVRTASGKHSRPPAWAGAPSTAPPRTTRSTSVYDDLLADLGRLQRHHHQFGCPKPKPERQLRLHRSLRQQRLPLQRQQRLGQ
jgi:hypothetical protein